MRSMLSKSCPDSSCVWQCIGHPRMRNSGQSSSNPIPPNTAFVTDSHLNLSSWNACGVNSFEKLLPLKAYGIVSFHHSSTIFLFFPGGVSGAREDLMSTVSLITPVTRFNVTAESRRTVARSHVHQYLPRR
ncbi:hypothetical protein E2C01_027245 [Portunus trituberculatus]|uniref:Uncharacterized protein n=1 Tax=Portunus trituberculatus TaxID=210409 RepID=A0A5B7EKL7_PORTR|nr:hypothetical protein [Portunus trituberculatus]